MQNPMRTHVIVIGWLNVVLGIPALLFGGALALFGPLVLASIGSSPDAFPLMTWFGAFWGLVLLLIIASALLGVIAGFGLLQFAPWARILCIIVSILHLVNASSFGVTTILGIYSLVILFHPATAELFEGRRP
jgi:hypothetical protein